MLCCRGTALRGEAEQSNQPLYVRVTVPRSRRAGSVLRAPSP